MLRRWRQGLAAALWPPFCLVCGEPGVDGRELCADCVAALPWNRNACPRCALPAPCASCRARPPPFAATQAALRYTFPLDRLLPRFKFHADLAAGRLVAQLMGDALVAACRPEALVPLPLHADRLRERGYDQALELARPLARRFALPLRADALRRVRATVAQTGLTARERRRNLRGAFAVAGPPLPAHVALVDDVMTTGATLAAATQALHAAGVARVDLWVAARALPPENRSAEKPGSGSTYPRGG